MCSYTTCSWCIHGCTWPKPDKFWRIGSISAHRCTQFVQSSENSGWLTSMALSPTISLPRPPPWWSCPKSHQDQQYYLKSSYMFVTGCTQTSIILDCSWISRPTILWSQFYSSFWRCVQLLQDLDTSEPVITPSLTLPSSSSLAIWEYVDLPADGLDDDRK